MSIIHSFFTSFMNKCLGFSFPFLSSGFQKLFKKDPGTVKLLLLKLSLRDNKNDSLTQLVKHLI